MATRIPTGTATGRGKAASSAARTSAEKTTGGVASSAAPDELYGVVSVLYHALQGAQTYEQYLQDARKAGDSELERFFDECKSEESVPQRGALVVSALAANVR